MALVYPLDLGDFFDLVPVTEQTFDLSENVEVSGLANGAILRDQIGPRLWYGRCSIEHMTFAQARKVEARLQMLQEPGASFLIPRRDCQFPAADPQGLALQGSSPEILDVSSDLRQIRLTGLPEDYALGLGDMFAFTYGSSPVRYALHRVGLLEVIADETGNTGWFDVTPSIRPGATAGTSVNLVRPRCKAILVPGSLSPGRSRGVKNRGMAFEFIQSLR